MTDALSTLPLKLSTKACTSVEDMRPREVLTLVPLWWLVEEEHDVLGVVLFFLFLNGVRRL